MGPSSVVSCLHLFFFSFLDLLPTLQLHTSTPSPPPPHLSSCLTSSSACLHALSNAESQISVHRELRPRLEKAQKALYWRVSASIHRKGDPGDPSGGRGGPGITLLLAGPVRGPKKKSVWPPALSGEEQGGEML